MNKDILKNSNIHMNLINILVLLSLPFGIVGWYILFNDTTDRSIWKKIHSFMKCGRLHKVIRKSIS